MSPGPVTRGSGTDHGRGGRTAFSMTKGRCRRRGGTERSDGRGEYDAMQKCSIYEDCEREADRFKWIESEKAGRDLGEHAIRHWVRQHWSGYLRARWLEHLQGKTFW